MKGVNRVTLSAFACSSFSASLASAAEAGQAAQSSGDTYRAVGLAAAASFCMAVSVLGASYAVARIGAAALGAAAEKPELLARSLLFVAIAEGLAVLGFALAMVIVQRI